MTVPALRPSSDPSVYARYGVPEGTTATGLIRLLDPRLDAEDVEFLLWERTCFPVGGIDDWCPQAVDAVARQWSPPYFDNYDPLDEFADEDGAA